MRVCVYVCVCIYMYVYVCVCLHCVCMYACVCVRVTYATHTLLSSSLRLSHASEPSPPKHNTTYHKRIKQRNEHNTTRHNLMQGNAMQCNAMQCNTIQYNRIQNLIKYSPSLNLFSVLSFQQSSTNSLVLHPSVVLLFRLCSNDTNATQAQAENGAQDKQCAAEQRHSISTTQTQGDVYKKSNRHITAQHSMAYIFDDCWYHIGIDHFADC
jgi:hypothetical protein